MFNITKKYICKNCGKVFDYDERPFLLKAEKGESRPERCQDCRQIHGTERQKAKVSYFLFQEQISINSDFNSLQTGYTLHGNRILQEEIKEPDWPDKEFAITDEDILAFYEKLENNQVVIVVAPTGSGKSTFIPYRLLIAPPSYRGDLIERLARQGQIIITQPLTSAVERIPETIAKKLLGSCVGPGQIFGLRHGSKKGGREGGRYDRWNLAAIVTDGSLRNWIRDGKLSQYSLIMVDEAHQRSCNIETILMLLKNELPRYPNLKVVVSSATINAEFFRDTFKATGIKADIFDLSHSAKREYQYCVHFWKDIQTVESCDCWLCQNQKKEKIFLGGKKDSIKEFELSELITDFVTRILKETDKGGILVFLHGETVIEDTARRIRTGISKEIPVISVYSRLGEAEVNRRLRFRSGKRRILVTTNIAETSHTLDDIVYVIDSGYIKEVEWNPDMQISTLPSRRHSKDGCHQRWGRVGRVSDGYVYCLYTKDEFEQFDAHTSPEVERSCLNDVSLTLNAAGISNQQVFPWLVDKNDFKTEEERKRWDKEIKRAANAVFYNQFVKKDGLITEKALEIFYVPRSAVDIDILSLADEYNCALETILTVFLMASRDGEIRTGQSLYASGAGLLIWDSDWCASTKTKIWVLHQGLRRGCRDDLDFVIKLACCFLKAEEKGVAEQWARYYQLNFPVFQEAIEDARELFSVHYRSKAQEEERNLDIGVLERVRWLLSIVWQNKIIKVKDEKIISFWAAGKNGKGVVSPHCIFSQEKNMIAATAVEGETVIKGYPCKVAVASFLINPPIQKPTRRFVNVFLDQIFPIGSMVKVAEENGKFYLSNLVELSPPNKIKYQKNIWLGEELKKEEVIPFDQMFICQDFKEVAPVEGIWFGKRKAEQARIIRWEEKDGVPVAILSPFAESDISKLGKKRGDSLRVKIHRVVRDPIGKSGWTLAQAPEFEIPVELNELSLSNWGAGLEQLEGQTLSLFIKDFDDAGFPQLTNIERIIEDLRGIRKEISESGEKTEVSERPYIELSGFVVEIKEDEERTIVVVPREKGILHPFEIAQDYVPDGNLKNLRVNEEILLRLFQTGLVEIPANDLINEEIKNRAKNWKFKEEENKVLVPPCLENKDLENWSARPEAIDFVKRHSWQYCLQARIVSLKERLSNVEKARDAITKIRQNIVKNQNTLAKIRQNIATNQARADTARTREYKDKFMLWVKEWREREVERIHWIEEDERKIRDIELSIRDLLAKIESTRSKLKQQ